MNKVIEFLDKELYPLTERLLHKWRPLSRRDCFAIYTRTKNEIRRLEWLVKEKDKRLQSVIEEFSKLSHVKSVNQICNVNSIETTSMHMTHVQAIHTGESLEYHIILKF